MVNKIACCAWSLFCSAFDGVEEVNASARRWGWKGFKECFVAKAIRVVSPPVYVCVELLGVGVF